jgi:hypothetical protein
MQRLQKNAFVFTIKTQSRKITYDKTTQRSAVNDWFLRKKSLEIDLIIG